MMEELVLVRDAIAAVVQAHGIVPTPTKAAALPSFGDNAEALRAQIPMVTADAVFAKLDLNGDGVISRAEWQAMQGGA